MVFEGEEEVKYDSYVYYKIEKILIYFLFIPSLFFAFYFQEKNYLFFYFIALSTFFLSKHYQKINIYVGHSFKALSYVSLLLIIPTYKEVLLIEILFIPIYLSLLKIISLKEIIKKTLILKIAYYISLYALVLFTFNMPLFQGIGTYLSIALFLTELFAVNAIFLFLLNIIIYKLKRLIYISTLRILLYSVIYAFLTFILLLFTAIIP